MLFIMNNILSKSLGEPHKFKIGADYTGKKHAITHLQIFSPSIIIERKAFIFLLIILFYCIYPTKGDGIMKDTKQWILEAAALLFAKNGFSRTTTRAIAKLAGVHESTFFRIYKNKNALLSDLLYVMTPSPDDVETSGLTDGVDLCKDFEIFLYYNAILHIKHIPVFRLAMHVDEIYNQQRFSKIKAMVVQIGDYFQDLNQKGLVADFDYYVLAEHINSLVLIKSSEFIAGQTYGIPPEKSAQNFAHQYACYLARLLSPPVAAEQK